MVWVIVGGEMFAIRMPEENRIIHSNTTIKQFYCKKCKRGHNDLVIYNNRTYCKMCVPIGEKELSSLPVYGQDGNIIKR